MYEMIFLACGAILWGAAAWLVSWLSRSPLPDAPCTGTAADAAAKAARAEHGEGVAVLWDGERFSVVDRKCGP